MAGTIVACAAFALAPAPATAKKKRKLGPVVTRSASVGATEQGQHVTATATCPPKRKAVGGGWTEPRSDVYRSVRDGNRGWTNSALMRFNPAPLVLTTYVYCRRVKKPILDVTGTGTAGASRRAVGTAVARCPGKKKKLIAGGFSSDVGSDTYALAFPYVSSASGKKNWVYSAMNNRADEARTLTSHAYCTKGVKAAKRVSSTSEGTVAEDGSLSASSPGCSAKKTRLSAGGFSITPSPAPDGLVPAVVENRIKPRPTVFGPEQTWFARMAQISGDTVQATITSQGICTK